MLLATARHGNRRSAGFSLIELMIAVAVVAILASIALPSYREYVKRGKRAAAQSVLMDLAARQQAFLLDKRGYATAAQLNFTSWPPEIAADYTIAGTVTANNAASPPTFTITAKPTTTVTGSGIMADDGDMTIDQTGTKTPANLWKK